MCRCMMGTSSTKGAFPLEAESSLVRGCSTAAGWRTGLFFQQSDYIFSVAGEELGFVGCSLILLLLFLFMLKALHVAHSSRDDLGKYVCFGYFGIIALQSISNIGMCLAVLPAMGVTLPFFSAGGSSAVCMYLGFGLVQSVYMRRKESDGLRLKRRPLQRVFPAGR